jgi:MYXO-CTERM domain-containing protein
MSTRMKVAFWCYALGALIVTAFGIVYLMRPEFMPYHSVAVGLPWAAVDPSFQMLILALMRAVGSACLALAILQWTLLLIPFRRGAAWATWAIALSGLVMCAGSFYAMMLVAQNTPATPPWIAPAAGAVLLIVGLVFSLRRRAS